MRREKKMTKRQRFGGLRFLLLAHPILTVVACALALTVSLLGTYAWFTNQAELEPVTFTTANLKLELDTGKDKTVVKRFACDPDAFEAQLSLIGDLNDEPAIDVNDEALADWLEEYADNLASILTDTNKAAPMSFAFRSYKLTNGSDVPVYFRIDRPKLSGENEIAFATLYQIDQVDPIESTDGVSQGGTLIPDEEGVLYCMASLYPGDAITVTFVVYLGKIKSGKYTLSSEYAEIIQAANNAVFMSPGWEEMADKLESYIE